MINSQLDRPSVLPPRSLGSPDFQASGPPGQPPYQPPALPCSPPAPTPWREGGTRPPKPRQGSSRCSPAVSARWDREWGRPEVTSSGGWPHCQLGSRFLSPRPGLPSPQHLADLTETVLPPQAPFQLWHLGMDVIAPYQGQPACDQNKARLVNLVGQLNGLPTHMHAVHYDTKPWMGNCLRLN